jgi:uncharacterized protein (UPF0303 family)
LAEDEARLVFDRFTNDDAIALGLVLLELARAEGAAVAIDVTRGGQQLFHVALAGTSADNDQWIIRKNRVVTRFAHSSYYMGTLCRSKGHTLSEMFFVDDREFGAFGGAFPIIVRDVGVVGTVTVSGLAQSDDHRLVVTALEQVLAAG